MNSIDKKMKERELASGARTSEGESKASGQFDKLRDSERLLVIIDFPTEGVPDERNFPLEIGDWTRKYLAKSMDGPAGVTQKSVFHTLRDLQVQSATVRVFAEPTLHELVTRYLTQSDVRACVEAVVKLS